VRDAEQWPELAHGQAGPVATVGRAGVGDVGAAALGNDAHEFAELAGLEAGERGDPLRARCRDHLHPAVINDHPETPTTGLRDNL
jgi:hypothetical protein